MLGFLLGAWLAWQEVQAEGRQRVLRSVDLLHEHALRAFEMQEALLEAVDARIAPLDWDAIATSADVHRFLLRLRAQARLASGFGLVNPAGHMVMLSRDDAFPLAPIDQRDRDYVQAHQAGHPGTYVGIAVASRPSGQLAFPMARLRSLPDGGHDGGILVSAFTVDSFVRFYTAVQETPGDRVALVRLDGALLAGTIPPSADGAMRLAATAPLLRALQSAGPAAQLLEAGAALDGATGFVGHRRVAGYPVAVVFGLSRASLREAWWPRLWLLGAGSLAGVALLLGLTGLAARSARRESTALLAAAAEAEAARRAAEGRAQAEHRLRQSERIAALGQVSAGVAHDMNNLVQNVLASARLLDRRAGQPEEVRRLAALLRDAAERGQRLAHRMLDFGRPAGRAEESFDLAGAIGGVRDLVGGLLGSGVRLVATVPPGLPEALADRGEFETVLVNLAVNARDAMAGRGEVRVSAALAGVVPPELRRAGPWLRVDVSDSGRGMTAEVLARAGEPFFSTKPRGEGTGLGLMMARQFAERAGGTLSIGSAPGQGTTVTLWLPAAGSPAADMAIPASAPSLQA